MSKRSWPIVIPLLAMTLLACTAERPRSEDQAREQYEPVVADLAAALSELVPDITWDDVQVKTGRTVVERDCRVEVSRFGKRPEPGKVAEDDILVAANSVLHRHQFSTQRGVEHHAGEFVINARDSSGAKAMVTVSGRVFVAVYVPTPDSACG